MVAATSTIVFVDAGAPVDRLTARGAGVGPRAALPGRAFAAVIGAHGGRIGPVAVQGVVAAFDSASDAVRAAVDLQRAALPAAAEAGPRIGVAVGDVHRDDASWRGAPIDVAVGLGGHAAAGQILVTGLVHALADRAVAAFERLGMVSLGGLAEPVEVYAAGWAPGPPTGPPRLRVPCPAAIAAAPTFGFVGRAEERRHLAEVWAAVEAGQSRTVLIGGEPGAGKTRLAFEFARHCAGEGAIVLLGVCDTELAIPYQPWAGALDQLIRAMPVATRSTLADELADVGPLVPQLERAMGGFSGRPPADPESERYRLFHAVGTLFGEAAREAPLVIVLDDLHWAGPQTLALLRHLARGAGLAGVAIVGTFRDTGDEITDPLASCLADLRRSETVSRLRLGGLDPAAVEQLVEGVAGHGLDAGLRTLAATLAERSAGNAFFVGELWRHAVSTGLVARVGGRWQVGRALDVGVPDSVREVVTNRLQRLTAPARQVLEVAAIAGQRVERNVLDAAVELAPEEVGAGLDELVEAKLLIAVGSVVPDYEFVHAIVRDTVEQAIPASGRARLHLRMGEAVAAVHRADRRPVLSRLARHYAAAAEVGGAIDARGYLRQAAAQAMRSVAYDEAIGHLRLAARLAIPGSVERVDILLDLATALVRNGLEREGTEHFGEAFRAARGLGLVQHAARAAAAFNEALQLPGQPGGPAVEMVSQALALLDDEETTVRVRLQASLARALAMAGRTAEARGVGEAALAAARRLADPGTLAVALQSALVYSAEPERYLRDAIEALALARELDDGWVEAFATGCLVRGLLVQGRVAEAKAAAESHRQAAERGRFVIYRYMALSFDVMFALIDGRLDGAEQAAERAHHFGSTAQTSFDAGVYGLQMYVVRREQGRLGEVAGAVRLAAALGDRAAWRPGLVSLLVDLGMVEEARAEFERVATDDFAAVPRDAMWPCSLAFLAEVCLALGDRERAVVLRRELQPFVGQALMVGFTICLGPAERLLGRLAALVGDHAAAGAHLTAALEMAERSGSPWWSAQVHLDWAVVPRGRPELLESARRIAEAHGLRGLVERCASAAATMADAAAVDAADAGAVDAAASARSAAIPGAAAGPPTSADPGSAAFAGGPPVVGRPADPAVGATAAPLPDGLSAREVEVLRLVAEGLSNRAIGERLFISANTAANHVRSILQKTGSANRAEATAYAARHGLLSG